MWEFPKCDTETRSEQMLLEKTVPVDLISVGYHTSSSKEQKQKTSCGEHSKVKHSKTRQAFQLLFMLMWLVCVIPRF